MADPATRTFFGSGWDNSGIEIPEPESDAAYYALKDVPHGQVSQRWYFSKVTGKWRRCYVYTPPGTMRPTRADAIRSCISCTDGAKTKQGWHTQGHMDVILDNLIAEKKAKPMIVVMDNLNAVKPGEMRRSIRRAALSRGSRSPIFRPRLARLLRLARRAAARHPLVLRPQRTRWIRSKLRWNLHRDDAQRPDPDG